MNTKKLHILFFIVIFNPQYVIAQKPDYLYRVIDTSEVIMSCAYVNEERDTIIPFGEYELCYTDTIKTIGFVLAQGGVLAIDKCNRFLFKVFIFDNGPDYIREGVFRIIGTNQLIGFADMNGKVVIPPQFEFVRPFKNGVAAFCMGSLQEEGEYKIVAGGKWGLIDIDGKIVAPAIYNTEKECRSLYLFK